MVCLFVCLFWLDAVQIIFFEAGMLKALFLKVILSTGSGDLRMQGLMEGHLDIKSKALKAVVVSSFHFLLHRHEVGSLYSAPLAIVCYLTTGPEYRP